MAAVGGYILMVEEEERLRRYRSRLLNRHLRDRANPFELPERQFLKLFRLNKVAVQHVVDVLSPGIQDEERSTAVPKHLKILCALHFFGHGSYQMDAGAKHVFCMSQPVVSRCIQLVVGLINNFLLNEWIVFPRNREDIDRNMSTFQQKYNFPGIVGVIDCSHIAIIASPALHPQYPAGPYYNRKGYYSINVQIICNAKLQIMNMNARFPGSTHDSGIWRMSSINRNLHQEYLNNNLNYHLIGDEGYPLQSWLMVQHPGDFPDESPEGRFNRHLITARTTIERVNGILKGRFRCLLKHRTLNYNPIKAAHITYACGVLHNMAIYFNTPLPDNVEIEENVPNNNYNDDVIDNNFFARGAAKRLSITRTFFGI